MRREGGRDAAKPNETQLASRTVGVMRSNFLKRVDILSKTEKTRCRFRTVRLLLVTHNGLTNTTHLGKLDGTQSFQVSRFFGRSPDF